MGCRNILISVALTYQLQLLRLIGLSLVWRCLSRGGSYAPSTTCFVGTVPWPLSVPGHKVSRKEEVSGHNFFSSLSRSEWVTGKKKVSSQFAQSFILIRFCLPFWRHLLKVLSSKVVTTNQAMSAWRKGQGQVSRGKGRDGKGMCLNEELSRRFLKW